MKAVYIIAITMLILAGCENQNIVPKEAKSDTSRKFENLTWELMEIRNLNGDWRKVTPEEKHFLIFVNDHTVTYLDAQKTCEGEYEFVILENAIVPEQLTLKVPCMVPTQNLWWDHSIEVKTESEVITYPQLNPTAHMSYERFKYRIIQPDHQ